MWTSYLIVLSLTLSFWCCCTFAVPKLPSCSLVDHEPRSVLNRSVSYELFYELEELSRIVNIAYCVGTTGIQNPFLCAGRCQDFKNFELVTVSATNYGYSCSGSFTDQEYIIDVEHWALFCRLVRLHCAFASAFVAAHHRCLSRDVLDYQYYHRSFNIPTRICPISRGQ